MTTNTLRKIGQKHFIMYPAQKHIYVKKKSSFGNPGYQKVGLSSLRTIFHKTYQLIIEYFIFNTYISHCRVNSIIKYT